MVAISTTTIAITFLYNASFEQAKDRLVELAQSQERIIDTVGHFDAKFSIKDHPQGNTAATLGQVIESHESYKGFGKTGEFTLGKLNNQNI